MICVRCSKNVRDPGIHTCWDANKKHLVRVVGKRFVCGLIFEGVTCIEAAPFLRWCHRKQWRDIAAYFHRRGWEFDVSRIE